VQPVPDDQLPVLLPDRRRLRADRRVAAQSHAEFLQRQVPALRRPARRETDTMDTFVDSSWYFLRYLLAAFRRAVRPREVERWMPVHQYTGGAEHAVMHLMYFRFFTKALRDLGC
jgi:leucyl-tRNA synthetase